MSTSIVLILSLSIVLEVDESRDYYGQQTMNPENPAHSKYFPVSCRGFVVPDPRLLEKLGRTIRKSTKKGSLLDIVKLTDSS